MATRKKTENIYNNQTFKKSQTIISFGVFEQDMFNVCCRHIGDQVSPKTVSRARTQEMSKINANISRIRAKKQFLGLTDFGHQYND